MDDQKAQLSHGEWLPWVMGNCAFKPWMAQKYMGIAEKNVTCHVFEETTSIRGALRLLQEEKPKARTLPVVESPAVFSWVKHPDYQPAVEMC